MEPGDVWFFVGFFTAMFLTLSARTGIKAYLHPDRVALRAIRRTAKRIRKIGARIAHVEQQMAFYRGEGFDSSLTELANRRRMWSRTWDGADEARILDEVEIEAARRMYVESSEKDLTKLRAQLAAEVESWIIRVEYYHKLCPPSVPEEEATYRVAPPKVRVAQIIEETEELLAYLAPKALAADS